MIEARRASHGARCAEEPAESSAEGRRSVRRVLSWALVGALCVAALTAVAAILSGGFDETDGRVIATSLGFAVFTWWSTTSRRDWASCSPILRRLAGSPRAADRIQALKPDPGNRAAEIRRECERLRELARARSG